MANNLVNNDSYAFVEGVTQNDFNNATFAATQITSGTLDSARLPVVPVSKGGTGATTAQGARDFINAANRWTKIWENSAIASPFAAQTIDLSDAPVSYNFFMVVYRTDWEVFPADTTNNIDTQVIYLAEDGQKSGFSKGANHNTGRIIYRKLTINWNDTTRSFVYSNGVSTTSYNIDEDASILKPYYIFATTI